MDSTTVDRHCGRCNKKLGSVYTFTSEGEYWCSECTAHAFTEKIDTVTHVLEVKSADTTASDPVRSDATTIIPECDAALLKVIHDATNRIVAALLVCTEHPKPLAKYNEILQELQSHATAIVKPTQQANQGEGNA